MNKDTIVLIEFSNPHILTIATHSIDEVAHILKSIDYPLTKLPYNGFNSVFAQHIAQIFEKEK